MQSEFPIGTVLDIALEMGDAPFGSKLKTKDYTASGPMVVQGKNLAGRVCDWSDTRHVSVDKYESLTRHHARPGDLVFPKVGTIGKVGILTRCEGVEQYVLSTNTMRLRVQPGRMDQLFVYYYFSSRQVRETILRWNSKSVQPVFNFTSLKKFPVPLPPLPEQRRIAAVLGALDDKIELNRKMNQTLEEMAQALFKSWFIDFDGHDPADLVDSELGPIPRGWGVGRLDEAVEVRSGKPIKKAQRVGGHTPVFGANGVIGHTELDPLFGPCTVLGKIGSCGSLHRSWRNAWVSNNAFSVQPRLLNGREIVWFTLQQVDFKQYIGGSANPYMPLKNFGHHQVIVPPIELQNDFETAAGTLARRQQANNAESRTLADLRDALLPKLISGEIRVPEAEAAVGAAL